MAAALEQTMGNQPIAGKQAAGNGASPHFSVVRIIEALVIGAIATGGAMWGTQAVIGEKLNNLASRQAEFQDEMRYEIRRIRDDFYSPRYMQQPRPPQQAGQ